MKIGHIYFPKPTWSHILYLLLKASKSGFPARTKESHFRGIVSDKEDNIYSKALKKQNNLLPQTKKISTMRSSFLQFMLKAIPYPRPPDPPSLKPRNTSCCPRQLLLLAQEIKAAQITCQQLRRFSHPRQQVCWTEAWGRGGGGVFAQPTRDCTSEDKSTSEF